VDPVRRVHRDGGHTDGSPTRASKGLRAVREPSMLETPRARTGDPATPSKFVSGPVGEGHNQKSNMHVDGESDGRTVPTSARNKSGKPLARHGGKATDQREHRQTTGVPDSELDQRVERLGSVCEKQLNRKGRHGSRRYPPCECSLLLGQFYAVKRRCCTGVDGVTWKEYETDLG